jgi:hypothetical protein
MTDKKTRTTAARLDRFKKAGDWTQRRTEEGFACDAACMAQNYRVKKSDNFNDLKRRCEQIEGEIYKGALDNLKTLEELETLEAGINSAQVKIARGWHEKQDPVQDIIDLHEHERSKTGCFPPVIAGTTEYEAFAEAITGGPWNDLDKIGRLACFDRLHWIKKPEIESWKFRYDAEYFEDETLVNLWHVLWNYEETDAGLKERIKKANCDPITPRDSQKGAGFFGVDPVIFPGEIHKTDCESKSDFPEIEKESSAVQGKLHKMTLNDEPFECSVGYRQENGKLIPDHLAVVEVIKTPWQRFKAIDWRHEIKDAFPFFCSDVVQAVKKSMEPQQEQVVWRTTEDQRIRDDHGIYNIDTSAWPPYTELFLDPDRPGALTDIPPLGYIPHNCRCSSIEFVNVTGKEIEDGAPVYFDHDLNSFKPVEYLPKVKIIHGEDEFFAMFSGLTDLEEWADTNKIFVAYYPVDIDRMPDFSECNSLYILKPLYVGNFSPDDQCEMIRQIIFDIFPQHERII